MTAIIPLTLSDSDSINPATTYVAGLWGCFLRHNAGLAKSVISPELLSQPRSGRNQGVEIVVIIVLV